MGDAVLIMLSLATVALGLYVLAYVDDRGER